MMKTLKRSDLAAWVKRSREESERRFRVSLKELIEKNLVVVRIDEKTRQMEITPTPNGAASLRSFGIHGPTTRSFKS